MNPRELHDLSSRRATLALAIILGLASFAPPAEAQLSPFRSTFYTEGHLFLLGPADDDQFGEVLATGDFNGDGADDLATGVPTDDNLGALYPDSGIVIVRFGIPGVGLAGGVADLVLSQAFGASPDPADTGDQLGYSLASADFDGDGFDDLAVDAVLDGPDRGGAVQVYYGSLDGLDLAGAQYFHQDSPGISGESERLDYFGYALAAGDFDGDGFADLAVGIPGEDMGLDIFVGRMVTLYGSAAGLSASRSQSFDQDLPAPMDGSAEEDDKFGHSLACGDFNGDGFDDVAVGVPGENDGGGVHFILGSPTGLTATGNGLWTQDDPGVFDTDESGDWFGWKVAAADFSGDGYDDVAVSAYGEDLELGGGVTIADAGALHLFFGSPTGIGGASTWMWTQSSTGLGASEAGDLWGSALAAGDFDADGYADLAIGAPHEGLGALAVVGEVTVLRGYPDGLSPAGGQLWSQNSPGVPGADEQGDEFASALAAGDFDGSGHTDLAIGAPRESVEAFGDGAEWVLYGALFADGFDVNGNASRWSSVSP